MSSDETKQRSSILAKLSRKKKCQKHIGWLVENLKALIKTLALNSKENKATFGRYHGYI